MFRLFPLRPKRSKPGWVALCPAASGLAAVHVQQGGQGRARVLWVEALTTGVDEMERLARSRGLSAYRITTLMPPGSYQLLQMNAPAVPRHEWKEALRWQLKDFIDFPAEQATFDVLDIPTESHAPGRPHMVFVAVARNEQVGEIMARYDRAHLNLQAIDIPELALRNVAALLEDETGGWPASASISMGACWCSPSRGSSMPAGASKFPWSSSPGPIWNGARPCSNASAWSCSVPWMPLIGSTVSSPCRAC